MPRSQTRSKVVADPRKYLSLFYGPPGVGKTTFVSNIENHHVLKTEEGCPGVEVFADSITSFEEFQTFCVEIVADKKNGWKDKEGKAVRPVSLIAIDTYDKLHKTTAAHLVKTQKFMTGGKMLKYTHVDDVPFGKAYSRTSELLIRLFNVLRVEGFGIYLLSHLRERTAKLLGQDTQVMGPKLSPQSVEDIYAACDCVGYFMSEHLKVVREEKTAKPVYDKSNVRKIIFAGRVDRPAKHRFPTFPDEIIVGRLDGWKTYQKAFQKAYLQDQQEKQAILKLQPSSKAQ